MRRLFYQYLLVGGYLLLATALSFFSVTTSAQLNPQWIGVNALMPQAMHWSAVCTYDGKIYVFGGNANDAETNTTYIYDPSTDSWTQGADMPTPRYLCTAAEVDGKIYVMGGRQLVASLNPVDVNECYDPVTNTWTTKTNMPNAIRGHAACTAGGKIYVLGGNTGAYTDTVSIYDPTANSWANGIKMPAKAGYGGAVYSSSTNSIFWVGGVKSSTDSASNFIGKVYAYSFASNSWDAGTAMPDKTAYFGLATNADGSEVYIVSGSMWSADNYATVSYPFTQVFYTASKTFDNEGLYHPSPWNRENSSAAFANGTLYLLGGDGTALIDSCNPSTGEFYEPNFPINDGGIYAYISGGVSGAINGKFYVVDGGFYVPLTGSVYAYDPGSNMWAKKNGTDPAPRMYATGGQWNDKVVVYGGMVEDGSVVATATVYDPLADTFTAYANSNPNLSIFETSVVLNDKLYVIGGRPDPADAETLSKKVSILDLNNGAWSTGADMPVAIERAAAAAYNNKIYLFGGIDNVDPDYINEKVYIYDPAANSWTTGPSQEIYKQAYGAIAFPYNNHILVDSGYNLWYNDILGGTSGGMLGNIQIFDPATNTFKTEIQRPFGKMRHCSVVIGDRYYSTAGEDPDWPVTRLDIATFGPPVCTVSCSASAMPASGQAPLAVNFTGSATASNCTGTPTYAWTFSDGGTSTEQNPSHTYLADGTYNWSLTVTVDNKTCTKSGTVQVGCVLNCNAAAMPSAGYAPLNVEFTGTATATSCNGTPTYAWTFGDGGTSTEQNPNHVYMTAGCYDSTLTVSVDGEQCFTIGSINVTSDPCAGALDCSTAIALTPDVPITSTTTGQSSNVCSYTCSTRYESGPEVVHRITTTQAGNLIATLTGISADLNVFILLGCQTNTCVSGGSVAAFYDRAPAGTYYIVVDGRNGAQGNYTLTVNSCVAPTAPKITSIEDRNACALTGVRVNYTPGTPAIRHDLYRNGILVYPDYPSGSDYIVGDSSVGSFYVYAVNGFNCYTPSFEAYASDRIDCCVAPTMPEITSITDRDICLYSGVTINYTPGTPVTRHDLYRNGVLVYPDFPNGGNYVIGASSSTGSFCVYAENGGCNTRSYNVYGVDRNDCCTKPSKPVITSITDKDPCLLSGIKITYTPGAPATRHDLYKGAVLVYQDYPSGADYIVGDSSVGSFYVYAVNGFNCYTKSLQSYGYDRSDGSVPAAPEGMASTSNCSGNTISWNPVPDAGSYNVQRGTTCGTALTTYANVTSPYTDTTAVAGTTYNYWVVAVNSCGTSGNSSCVTATRLKAPTAPTGIIATPGCTGNTISWDSVQDATSYNVKRGTTCGTALATYTNVTSPYTDTSAVAGTTYNYWVLAVNACGTSSNSACVTAAKLVAPSTPSAPIYTNVSCNTVTVNWNGVSMASAYDLYRKSGSCGTGTLIAGNLAELSYNDGGLIGSAQYSYYLVAKNDCGSSASGGCSTVTTTATPSAPEAPVFSNVGCTSLTITWTGVSGASSYDLYRKIGSCGTGSLIASDISGISYVDTGLVGNTLYSYYLIAKNSCGSSDNGTCSSVTTSVCAPNIAFQAIGAYVQITGDSDSYFEKGEKWLVPVTVTNSGNIPATNVMANFTGNGITVCNNPGIFGTIEAGGSASFTFEFLIDSDFTPCGGNINFNLGSKTCAELTPAGTDETNLFSIQVGQIIAGSPTDLVLQPSSADSFVNQASAGTNYGSGMTISVQSRLSQAQRTLVMFDLSGIPEDSVINSATLELYASSAPTTGLTLNVHRITGTWTESAVTWTNQPAYNSTVDASLAGGTTAGWKIWNIASLVQEWINGTSANYGLTVKGSVENDKTALTYAFASKENTTTGNRPILRINYTPPTTINCDYVGTGECDAILAECAPGDTYENGQTWSGTSQSWPALDGATGYRLYRGTLDDLQYLETTDYDSCLRYEGSNTSVNLADDDSSEEAGRLYWYIVSATNGIIEGPAGNERIVDSIGDCP